MSTSRFVKVAKKEIVTPYSNNISKVKVAKPVIKEAEKPIIREAEPVIKQAAFIREAEKPVMKEILTASAQAQHFPTTKEFDTSLEEPQEVGHNWSSSFFGLSTEKFPRDVADILLEPINPDDIEIKPGNIEMI